MNGITRFLTANYSYTDLGLLVIRVVVGLNMFLLHGWGKITGGPERWERVGSNMENLGIGFAPVFWGFLAALAESAGAVCLMLGVFFRPAAIALAATMAVAATRHLSLPPDAPASGWRGASHAVELLAVFLGLLAAGPGKYGIIPKRKD